MRVEWSLVVFALVSAGIGAVASAGRPGRIEGSGREPLTAASRCEADGGEACRAVSGQDWPVSQFEVRIARRP